jgi:hypothetical protein
MLCSRLSRLGSGGPISESDANQEQSGEEQIADQRVPIEPESRRKPRKTRGERLEPPGEGFCITGVSNPGAGIAHHKEDCRADCARAEHDRDPWRSSKCPPQTCDERQSSVARQHLVTDERHIRMSLRVVDIQYQVTDEECDERKAERQAPGQKCGTTKCDRAHRCKIVQPAEVRAVGHSKEHPPDNSSNEQNDGSNHGNKVSAVSLARQG